MVESLWRLREPAAVVTLAAAVVRLLVAVVGRIYPEILGSYPGAWLTASLFVLDPTIVVVLTAVVGSCVLWRPTAHARQLAVLAIVVLCAGVVLAVLFAAVAVGLGVANEGWSYLLWRLTDLAIPVVAVVALARLAIRQREALTSTPAWASAAAGQSRTPSGAGVPAGGGAPQASELAVRERPTWQPDEASGAAWRSAQEAAAGGAASGWGTPGEPASWYPVPPGAPPTKADDAPERPAEQGPGGARWTPGGS